jgi:hypothetical protein
MNKFLGHTFSPFISKYQFSFLRYKFHRKDAKGEKKKYFSFLLRDQKGKSFFNLQVLIWPAARAGFNNPTSHGIEKKISLRSLRLCGEKIVFQSRLPDARLENYASGI